MTDDYILPTTNDSYGSVECYASNVLQLLSPTIHSADSKEPENRGLEHQVAQGDLCYGMVSLRCL